MFVGANVWDPTLIIAQILSMQFLFYLTMGLLQLMTLKHFVSRLSMSYIFDWHTLNLSSRAGWLNIGVHIMTAVITSGTLVPVVERAKKCLDFASTLYIWHLILVWRYSGWPASVIWWLTEGGSFAILALFGEWLCIRREMQDIPLSSLGGLGGARNRKDSALAPAALDDAELQPLRPRVRSARVAGGPLAGSVVGGSSSSSNGPAGTGISSTANGSGSVVGQLASFVRNAAAASSRDGSSTGGPRKVTPRGDSAV